MAGEVVSRKPGEGTALWMLGGLYEVKAASDETGGRVTAMEMTIPSGMGPPPHTHPGGEAVYVLEGTLDYHIGDETVSGGPGSFFYVPEGTVEHFEATGDTPLRVLVIYTPGGIDKFFSEVGEPAAAREIPPPSDEPPDFERIAAAGARYGMDIQTPPA
ncbi:MAG: cupin domain-containing protein [Actinomycetota bacterium]